MKAAMLVLVAACAVEAPQTPVSPVQFIGTEGRLLRDLDIAALVGNPMALQSLGSPYRVGPCLPVVCAAVGPILVVARPARLTLTIPTGTENGEALARIAMSLGAPELSFRAKREIWFVAGDILYMVADHDQHLVITLTTDVPDLIRKRTSSSPRS